MFLRGLAIGVCSLFLILTYFPRNTDAQQLTPNVSYPKLVYDQTRVVTVRGRVLEVAVHRCSMGWKNSSNVAAASTSWEGMHILLKTPYGRIDAHLGPTWYLKKAMFQVRESDFLDVTGSKFQVDGTIILITREVSKGARTIFLRDMEGAPLWLDGIFSSHSFFLELKPRRTPSMPIA
jgi:hypothetical protein